MTSTNPHKGRVGLDRLIHATGYSMEGLKSAYRNESAFRQETWLAVIALPLAFWVGQNWIEVALLAGSIVVLMVVELLNSAIEAAVDRIGYDIHELAKRAKDMGSAAVLLASLLTAGLWATAAWHHWLV
jgi:diacylglycerol kinase (ATP)